MANSLPMTLRVYRKLSYAMVPLAPALIKRRLKLGKEDPTRIGERRGITRDVRPHGPLVWIHGASVGAGLVGVVSDLLDGVGQLSISIQVEVGVIGAKVMANFANVLALVERASLKSD